jgi:hypothetical protein
MMVLRDLLKQRFVMTVELARWLSVPLMASFLIFAPVFAVHAAEDPRKVTVVSFGLFGDQGVFRSESTGAAKL